MMRRTTLLLVLTVLMIPTLSLATSSIHENEQLRPLLSHDIWLEPLEIVSFHIDCLEGQLLEGQFLIIIDSDLYPGDQQKYDIYPSLTGVDFLIFSEEHYDLWIEGSGTTPMFERTDVNELTWDVTISETDRWYIVYANIGIARKRIQGSFQIAGGFNLTDIGLIVGVISVGIVSLILYRHRYST